MPDNPSATAEHILDSAVELAEHSSWESLSLHQIADALDIRLTDIQQHFSSKDDLVEAWYDRADHAMLEAREEEGFERFKYRERLFVLMMRWLDFLARHRTVSRDMLLYKLEPAHIHLQLQGLLRISRTVQWLREAAGLQSTHLQRITEEVGLTAIYLQTFIYWMFDDSEQQQKTRQLLQRKLECADRLSASLFFHDTDPACNTN